jgi:hypothetical protein
MFDNVEKKKEEASFRGFTGFWGFGKRESS